ncbi:hypothetical protein [Streptosporangium sp. NPDC049376]|uniref:hypothetical protein n=1 Tax=Streptosporangium sp. NPDC049376 TaxID=3366192 RepID=UPI0037982BA9
MRIPPRPGPTWQFNPPPGWPPVLDDWEPTEAWGGPEEDWPPAPPYWNWWIVPESVPRVTESATSPAIPPEGREDQAKKTEKVSLRGAVLAGAATGAAILAIGLFLFRPLIWSSEDSPAITKNSAVTDDSDTATGGGATGADIAYETEWTTIRTRQVHINSPACSAIGYSEAACLANPGRWVSEPYSTTRRGFVCAADFDEASRLAATNNARLTGNILEKPC